MKAKWLPTIIVAVVVILTAALGPSKSAAAQTEEDGTTIPYEGRLTSDEGGIVDGLYTFKFSLYKAASGGEAFWTETQEDVAVSGGAFKVLLGSFSFLSKSTVTGQEWLEMSVRGPYDAEFTTLSPRQQVGTSFSESTTSASSCAHTHWYEKWGGTNNLYGFYVDNNGTGDGIRGESSATNATYAGVYGYNTTSGSGVYGYSTTGRGVFGSAGGTSGVGVYGSSSGATGVGVRGHSPNYRGVYGFGKDGVVGESATIGMSGVYGNNTSTNSATNQGYGVTGRATNGFGVLAWGNDSSVYDSLGDILLQGAFGEIFSNGSIDIYSNDNVLIDLDNDNNSAHSAFKIYNGADGILWSVTEASMVSSGTQATVVETADGQRLMYAIEGTGVWMEDIGTAVLDGGEVTVSFEAAYTQVAQLKSDYQVFVTAISEEPVLIYVSAKTDSGFTVRGVTLDGKPAACAFDYRIVAPRLGSESKRMESYTPSGKEMP